jgi:6-phosphogluconate dehydrogenase
MRVVASDIKAVLDFERGDIIVDAGNSYRTDSIPRHKRVAERKSHFIDPGTNGGMEGARHGACFMAERRQ